MRQQVLQVGGRAWLAVAPSRGHLAQFVEQGGVGGADGVLAAEKGLAPCRWEGVGGGSVQLMVRSTTCYVGNTCALSRAPKNFTSEFLFNVGSIKKKVIDEIKHVSLLIHFFFLLTWIINRMISRSETSVSCEHS